MRVCALCRYYRSHFGRSTVWGKVSEVIVSQHAFYESKTGGVDGFISRPVSGRWPAVVIGIDWWGVTEWTHEITRRLAEHGLAAFTPDIYHGISTTDHKTAARLKGELDLDKAVQEIVDAVPYLKSLPYVAPKVGVIGFCMGGGLALLAACRTSAFDAAVLFHHSIYPDAREVEHLSCPLQGHYGLADTVTPQSEVKLFESQLQCFEKPSEIHYYEGAGHGWMDQHRPNLYREETTRLSMQRTVEFFRKHLA
jgi:carboxymethylenebutenolidase